MKIYTVVSGCSVIDPKGEYSFSTREEAQDFIYSMAEERLYSEYYFRGNSSNTYNYLSYIASDFEIIETNISFLLMLKIIKEKLKSF